MDQLGDPQAPAGDGFPSRKPAASPRASPESQVASAARPKADQATNVEAARPESPASRAIIFTVFFMVRATCASFAPIQDCDEVFNFWEPTHYLNYGYGLQTWELSPDYAIRSWLYTSIHAAVIHCTSRLPFTYGKALGFNMLRGIFAATSATCEAALYDAVVHATNDKVGIIFVLISVSSAGMFHASVAYLPSTAAMYAAALAVSTLLRPHRQSSFAEGMIWLASGTILGWPFMAVLAVPFVIEESYHSLAVQDLAGLVRRIGGALSGSLIILTVEILFDSAFYRKLVCVPFNIVKYNIFSSGKGPNIYGVEPWHFYIRNLLINFNLWFLLACLTLPLLAAQCLFGKRRAYHRNMLASTSLFYVWLAIFTIQPHKEERFMFPIYPFIALNAALSCHILMSGLKALANRFDANTKSVSLILRVSIAAIAIIAITLGVLRIAGLATAYTAPLKLYGDIGSLHQQVPHSSSIPLVNICVSKEWYRFPSSYLLPNNARLKFVKSEFSGLLPGEFYETPNPMRDFYPGARMTPTGMNDENREDLKKYIPLAECDYLVDSYFPSTPPTKLEPDYVHDERHWERIRSLPFLDAPATGVIGRLFWMPESNLIPVKYRRRWGDYCLLRAKQAME